VSLKIYNTTGWFSRGQNISKLYQIND